MPATAMLADYEQRRSVRHPVDHPVIAEHARIGDLRLRVVNVSPEGFMAVGADDVLRGERLRMRLPVIGRIEAHLVWHSAPRAGFRFERLLRVADFTRMLIEIGEARHRRAND